jgi:hypothetical protein
MIFYEDVFLVVGNLKKKKIIIIICFYKRII